MESPTPAPVVSKKALWFSYIMSAVPVLMLLMSAVMKLMKPPMVVEGFTHMGWPIDLVSGLGILEIVCTVLYLIPRTAVLGAILVTGYFGGAIATARRIGDSWWLTLVLGVLAWGGLYLRDLRIRALLPCCGR